MAAADDKEQWLRPGMKILANNLVYVSSTDGLWLRENPSTTAKKIILLPFGDTISIYKFSGVKEVIGNVSGEWVEIDTFYPRPKQNYRGFIFSGFLYNKHIPNPSKYDSEDALSDLTSSRWKCYSRTSNDDVWQNRKMEYAKIDIFGNSSVIVTCDPNGKGYHDDGTIKISNDYKITMSFGHPTPLFYDSNLKTIQFKLSRDESSLEYLFKMTFEMSGFRPYEFHSVDYPVPEGITKNYNGAEVYTMGSQDAVISMDAPYYESPSANSKRYVFPVGKTPRDFSSIQSIPKGKELKVLARTTKQDSIASSTDYWYLVKFHFIVDKDGYEESDFTGWIFGKYITGISKN
jgi:hypothetical protein